MNFIRFLFFLIFVNILFTACSSSDKPSFPGSIRSDGEKGVLFGRKPGDSPLIKGRREKIAAILKADPPILLSEGASDPQKKAEGIAIKDARFLENTYDEKSKEPLLNEIFGIHPLREGDIIPQVQSCRAAQCFRVEMYNYAKNLTTTAVIDIDRSQVLMVTKLQGMQPDIPKHLEELAIDIALNSAEVSESAGYKPEKKDFLMSATKSALNKTRCERSLHLCVAPTLVKDGKALWAIVDLTDIAVVGVRWTQVGNLERPVTERRIQDEYLTSKYCESKTPLEKYGWKLDYMLTNSDGLKVENVSFNSRAVLNSAKLVDWHVSYSKNEGFGYSDAVGCPYFSHAAVIAYEAPKVSDIVKDGKSVGFILEQKYMSEGYPMPCNYAYIQSYEFYKDGSFRPAVASLGRGCGNDGTYRPVTRISFAGEQNNLSEFTGNDWKLWGLEGWNLQKADTKYSPEGYQMKIADPSGNGYLLEPNRGQFGDGSRGDFAYIYATKNSKDRDEGESELMTIGPCCNTDYKQGPEKFIEPAPENIENSPIVLWYVPQLKNDDTKGKEYCWAENYVENGIYKVRVSPCNSGPKFVPIKNE